MEADLLLGYGIGTHLTAFLLGTPRLLVFMAIAPFMGGAVITGMLRFTVLASLYLVLHPMLIGQVPDIFPLTGASALLMTGLILKEAFIGLVLGYLAGLIFWVAESAGFFIDNQRGAGQASETDPLSGDQTSPTGSFLMQSMIYAFFASGAFMVAIGIVYSTYSIYPVNAFLPGEFFAKSDNALFFAARMSRLMLETELLAAPVVLACLFTDMSLGLINRFASQLNVYVLAMPIKSAISSFLLILYFSLIMKAAPERFATFAADFAALRSLIP